MEKQPWYRAGLRFQCTQCGNCCTGAPGYVWVNQMEIVAIAEALQLADVGQFEQKFVRKIGIRKSLREHPNGDCVFFDGDQRACTVYHARPRQCRSWPFWNSNVRTPQDWRHTCDNCPGSGTGKLYSLEQIQANCGVIRI